MLEMARAEVLRRYQLVEEDTPLKALQASQIQGEAYFCHVRIKEWDAILHDIRKDYKNDTVSAPDSGNSLKMIKDVETALRVLGTYLDIFCHVIIRILR